MADTAAEAAVEKTNLDNISTSSGSENLDSSFSDVSTPVAVRKVEPQTLEESCDNMVDKITDYLNGELAATSADYKLLENLNKMATEKYTDMSKTTNNLITNMDDINERYKALAPYLQQIDLLEESVLKLEQTAYKLDSYSKQLETKFKTMERR